MSLFNSLFHSHWAHHAEVNRLDQKAEALEKRLWSERTRSDDVRMEVRELRRDVSRMLLAVEALQRVLADKGLCSGDDFLQRMRAIDAEDGIVDGRMSTSSPTAAELRYCDGCEHFNPANLKACQYCGRLFGA